MVQWYLSKKGESPMYRSRQEAPEEGLGEKRYNVTEREHVVPERGLDHNARGVGKSHGARGGGSHNNTLAATPASFCLYVHLR